MSDDNNDLIDPLLELKSHNTPRIRIRNFESEERPDSEYTLWPTPESKKIAPEPDPKPKTWKYIVWAAFLIATLWLSDVVGFAIPGFLDDIMYDTLITTIYSIIGFKITFPARKK